MSVFIGPDRTRGDSAGSTYLRSADYAANLMTGIIVRLDLQTSFQK